MATSSCRVIPEFGNNELLNLHHELGRGGMGIVYLYQWKINDTNHRIRRGQKAAVKMLNYSSDRHGVIEEAKILWPLYSKCEYILRMFGVMNSTGIGIVLDYMKYGNIADFFSAISSYNNAISNSVQIWELKSRIAMQVCVGMTYLHSHDRPILHCDLKAGNVLLDEDLNAKICDFGLAKIKRLTTKAKSDEVSKEQPVNCPAGTISHVAPELLRVGKQPTKKSDVYSFGILLWELLTGCTPYRETSSQFIIINEVLSKRRPDLQRIPTTCPSLLKTIMMEAWHQNPKNRPEFSELRLRFTDVEKRDIGGSVEFAKRTWDNHETRPKKLLTRSTDNCDRPESQSFFQTQEYTRPPIVQQQQILNNIPCNDPHTSEVMISDDNIASNDPTRSESANLSTENQRAPLIGFAPPSAEPKCCDRRVCKVTVFFLLACCLLVGAALAIGRYIVPISTKGCCLNCFNPFEPGMQSTCHPAIGEVTAPPGSTCHFACEDGYVLNGNQTDLKCGDNGVWSGPLPYCRERRHCPFLNPPANGGHFNCPSGNYEGSKCSFSCPDGYLLKRPNGDVEPSPGDFEITCKSDQNSNFLWSGEEPYCEKVVSCPSPTNDPKLVLKCFPPYPTDSESESGASKDQTYANGTICSFSCPAETSLVSNQTRAYCMNTGKWNISAVNCINAECHGTPWKRAEMNKSIQEIRGVSVYGSISKLSRVMITGDTHYFVGEMINQCSTMKFACFDEGKYPAIKKFREDGTVAQLLDVDIERSDRYGLQVIINDRATVIESDRTAPTVSPNVTTTTLRDIFDTLHAKDEVNVRARVVSKDPVKLIDSRGKTLRLYISHLSDDTAEIELRQWVEDRVPLNKTILITNLEVRAFRDKKYLQMQSVSEVKT